MRNDPRGEYLAYHKDVRACTACSIRPEAKEPVPGIGAVPNDVMIIGRNPGAQEDKMGLPFIGPSGQMVDDWLWDAGLSRNTVFITNTALCFTAANRVPLQTEVDVCTKLWLLKTLKFVQPKLVIPMGVLAAKLFGVPGGITQASGQVYNHSGGFVVIPSIHPGGVLRKRELKVVLDYAKEVVKVYVSKHGLSSLR